MLALVAPTAWAFADGHPAKPILAAAANTTAETIPITRRGDNRMMECRGDGGWAAGVSVDPVRRVINQHTPRRFEKFANRGADQILMTPSELRCRFLRNAVQARDRGGDHAATAPPNFKGHQVTKRLGILIAVIAAVVAGGLALGLGLMSNSHTTAIKTTHAAHTTTTPPTTPTTAVPAPPPPTTSPPTTVPPPPPTTSPPTTVPPPPPTTAPPVATPPAVVNGIAQDNGGDHDADNNGGPSDGDGNL